MEFYPELRGISSLFCVSPGKDVEEAVTERELDMPKIYWGPMKDTRGKKAGIGRKSLQTVMQV